MDMIENMMGYHIINVACWKIPEQNEGLVRWGNHLKLWIFHGSVYWRVITVYCDPIMIFGDGKIENFWKIALQTP